MNKKYQNKTIEVICKLDEETPVIHFEIKLKHVKVLIDHVNNAMLREIQFHYENEHTSCKE
jgi:hypothetical protein